MAEGTGTSSSSSGKILGVNKHTAAIVGIALGGGVVLYVGYRWLSSRSSSSSGLPLTGGTVVPTAVTGTVGGTTATPGTKTPISSVTGWIEAVLAQTKTLTPAQFYNAVANWQSGQSVTPTGFKEISKAIGAFGIPPGGVDYPVTVGKSTGPQTKGSTGPKVTSTILQTITTVPYTTWVSNGEGYSLTKTGKLFTGFAKLLNGQIWQTTATLTQALADFASGKPVGYLSGKGQVTQFTSVTQIKALEAKGRTTTVTRVS